MSNVVMSARELATAYAQIETTSNGLFRCLLVSCAKNSVLSFDRDSEINSFVEEIERQFAGPKPSAWRSAKSTLYRAFRAGVPATEMITEDGVIGKGALTRLCRIAETGENPETQKIDPDTHSPEELLRSESALEESVEEGDTLENLLEDVQGDTLARLHAEFMRRLALMSEEEAEGILRGILDQLD